MTYRKPEIVNVGPATESVQGTKPIGPVGDLNPTRQQTLAAYEADE
jgi:hypothetical protein